MDDRALETLVPASPRFLPNNLVSATFDLREKRNRDRNKHLNAERVRAGKVVGLHRRRERGQVAGNNGGKQLNFYCNFYTALF